MCKHQHGPISCTVIYRQAACIGLQRTQQATAQDYHVGLYDIQLTGWLHSKMLALTCDATALTLPISLSWHQQPHKHVNGMTNRLMCALSFSTCATLVDP